MIPDNARAAPGIGGTAAPAAASARGGVRHFHDRLRELTDILRQMADLAAELVEDATAALVTRDAEGAERVLARDREVDRLEVQIEELAVSLLALQQPVARDLRFVIGVIKMTNDLERVGDHAVNIAQSALRLAAHEQRLVPDPTIEEMTRRALAMLRDAVTAFIEGDGALGRAVCAADDLVDSLHDSVFRIMLTHMMADPRTINPGIELLLASRNLERVADLATNIGEDAVFLAEGKQIKHRAEL